MRSITICLLSLLLLVSCDADQNTKPHGPVYDGPPPERFRGDVAVMTIYTKDPSAYCQGLGIKISEGDILEGCAYRKGEQHFIVVPNPCIKSPRGTVCHEIGHVNGWSVNHER